MESATKTVTDLTGMELTTEIRDKLGALDVMLAQVFKSHIPIAEVPAPDAGWLEVQRLNVELLRNLENTMNELRGVNPMTLMKQLMGM